MTDPAVVPEIPEALDTDLFLTRVFAAPREVVWRFFTEPERLATWFGPHAVHVDPTTVRVELREGGAWSLDMVDNDSGAHYPLRVTLRTVIAPEYLEGSAEADTGDGPLRDVRLRIWLHDHGDRTRMTLHQGPLDGGFLDATRDGWQESFDKIDAILEEQTR